MNDIILLKQGEIILKGLNRRQFENKLVENIKRRLGPIGKFNVYSMQSTVYVEPVVTETVAHECDMGAAPGCDMGAALDAAKTVFGANSVTRAAACKKDKDAIVETAAVYLKDALMAAKSFKVESKRADKRFPMTSIELSKYVGGELQERFSHLKPDMHSPELMVNVEIRDLAAYVHGPAERGAGGLPLGTGGRMVTLLSGGIDSPVASYMMAKRGVRLIPVHFYSHPYTSVQAKEKVLELAGILSKCCGHLKVEMISFTQIQEEIRRLCPQALITVIMRRFMMRIAQRIAREHDCSAIVTGDNLGQVASQTAEALAVSQQCIDIPVFRPLISFDKRDIIDIAREIGTFETSIQPFEDCCTVFTPRRPRTKPKLPEIEAAEEKLNIERLVDNAITERLT